MALARDIKIRTRSGDCPKSFQVEYDDSWLTSDDWDLPYFEIDSLSRSTTSINLSLLRFRIEKDDVEALKVHLGCTYARFLERKDLEILVK